MSADAGAIEAVERILNRGGADTDVLRAVVEALHQRGIDYVALRHVVHGRLVAGPTCGTRTENRSTTSADVVYADERVGELEASIDDEQFLQRVALLISAHMRPRRNTHAEPSSH